MRESTPAKPNHDYSLGRGGARHSPIWRSCRRDIECFSVFTCADIDLKWLPPCELKWTASKFCRPKGGTETDDVTGLRNSRSRNSGAGARDGETSHPKEKRINKDKLLKGARMLDVPREDMKIIVHPPAGLRVSEVTRAEVSRALTAAAQIPVIELRKDVVCINAQQDIMVVSTSKRENVGRYAAVEQIDVRGTAHEVSTYEAAPHAQ
ncbi:hypothetical protein HPB48_013572 [Haemaphysalis longicornis]|uniref:Uncharacterized protein n=1 Tax=Haemaphysalis longicornis TaxID=44386 RepID=A0A9J6H3S8_HAELO|nr:hypothetical protein HPB48_013572 [Haemaphysalis longicornis]